MAREVRRLRFAAAFFGQTTCVEYHTVTMFLYARGELWKTPRPHIVRKSQTTSWTHTANERKDQRSVGSKQRVLKMKCHQSVFAGLILLCSVLFENASAFQSLARRARSTTVVMGLAPADEALSIFGNEYDYADNSQKESDGSRKLTDISEEKAKAAFQELSTVYGSERALDMVKALPICLAFDKSSFSPSLKAFQELFGDEEAKAMVTRNPGLLAVPPNEAAKSNEQTMAFSYIVAYTRPLGPLLAPFLFLFLASMVTEVATGVPLRTQFLQLFH